MLTMRERGTIFREVLFDLAKKSFKVCPENPYIVVCSRKTKKKWTLYGNVFWDENDYRDLSNPIIRMKISGKTDQGLHLIDPGDSRTE